MLKIYNTLTQSKINFQPIHPNQVGLYVCGVTVYDLCHLGHARAYVAFDMIYRYLKYIGYTVCYVRNITDIDDKILQRAQANREDWRALTARFTQAMHADFAALGLLSPDREPCATAYIPEMIALIQRLLQKGFAYVTDRGDVYYRVESFSDYGKLSHKDLKGLSAGARVDVNSTKDNALDFVLWKSAKPGEPVWSSPWGKGRPGWHIECSAMATTLLGHAFDIHGGGADLQFPHHDNEIAQSEGAFDSYYSYCWMHVGYLQINDQKMAKSQHNFVTIRDALKKYPAEVLRYFLLAAHYRSPLNFSEKNLDGAQSALTRLYQSLTGLPDIASVTRDACFDVDLQKFSQAMSDDFNTPQAMAVLFDLATRLNRVKQSSEPDQTQIQGLSNTLKHLAGILGLLQQKPKDFLQGITALAFKTQVDTLLKERDSARQAKDWQRADAIRDQLASMSVEILDGPEGSTWRRRVGQ